MAQLLISAAGAVAGGIIGSIVPGVGTALGAEIGWMAGGILGGLLIRQKGPQPGDLRVQDSAYGKPIPIVYGMFRVAGNVIWVGQPVEHSSGKGGAGKGPQQPTVTLSFAVGLCEGPITGIRRIWANGKLIYDVSNPSNFQAISGSSQMVTHWVLYKGDETQMPDPTIEATVGTGNAPAHRGLAYVVFSDLDLSPWGNYLPSLSFEVMTQSSSNYYQAVTTTWTPFNGATGVIVAPKITAQGAWALAYKDASTGILTAQLTPYGVQSGLTFPGSNPTVDLYERTGNSDTSFLIDRNGYWDLNGQFHACADFSRAPSGIVGLYNVMLAANGSLYLSSQYAFGYPIVRYDQLTGHQQATTGSLISCWNLIGATPSYLYASSLLSGSGWATPQTLYRLDANTLAVVNTWNFSTIAAGLGPGCVLDDDHIYAAANGTNWMLFRPSQNTWTNLGRIPFDPPSACAAINPNLFMFTTGGATARASLQLGYLMTGVAPNGGVPLSSIVADLCNRAGLSPSRYDVSQLTDEVRGYAITNHSGARSNLAPLMATYFFDACDTDGVLKFVRRGNPSVGTIAYDDLGASSSIGDTQNENPITEIIAQEVDLPRTLALTYSGLNSDYNPNTQRAFRAITRSNKDATMSAPIVLADDDGLTRAQSMLWAAWVGRKTFQFATRLGYLAYEPGDVMTLVGASGQTYTVRLTRCQYDGQGALVWSASLEQSDIYPNPSYTVQGGAPTGFNVQSIDYSGPTVLAVLDVPPLRDTDTTQALYLAACGLTGNWPGCMVDVSRDGTSFTDLLRIAGASVIGSASSALPNFTGGNQPDELSTVTIVVNQGALASVNYGDFLAGVNAAYLGGELLFFRNAVQTAANTYQLSGLLRGRAGTEWAMATHAIGDTFVLLDPTRLAIATLSVTDLGSTMYFEPRLLNLFASQPATPQQIVPTTARVKPLAPALFVANHGSASSTADITLSWIRRARVNAQWLNGTDVPLDQSAESYLLTISNASGVAVRSATVTAATSYIYTAAAITADGFTTGNPVKFSVAQNSDQGILGRAATTTLTR